MKRRITAWTLLALLAAFDGGPVLLALEPGRASVCRCDAAEGSCCCRRRSAPRPDTPRFSSSCCGADCRCAAWREFRMTPLPVREAIVPGPAGDRPPEAPAPECRSGYASLAWAVRLGPRSPPHSLPA